MRPLFLWTYARYSFIIKLLKKKKYNKIIEIWSWPFGISDYFNINFTWIDTIDKKVKNRSKKMIFKNQSALDIKEKDGSYDFVFSTDMLEHIDNKERICAIKEAIRISNDTCVIWFPCGKLAQLHDDLIFNYLEIKDKNRRNGRYGRLIEHIEKWLPTYNDIEKIKKEISELWYSCEEIRYNNIIWWKNIISLEMIILKLWYFWLAISTISVYLARFFRPDFECKEKTWYRVFLLIKKLWNKK